MAGPYDYSINIPQPPAQNFLQSLLGIRQLQQMQEQSAFQQQQAAIAQQAAAFQQQMQPLERQKLEAAIAAQRASTAQSGAATNLLGVQTTVAKLGLADKQLISSTLQNYFKDETKTIKDLAPILPLLDATAVENLGKAEQIRVNNEVSARLNEGKEITASDIRGWSNRQTLLKGPEQQQFQQSFLAMTPQFQSAAKSGMINAVNAAFAGNMEAARNSAAEVQQALINSKDTSPAAKAVSDSFGKIVNLIDQNPNIPKEILALNAVNAANLVGDPRLAEDALKVVKEFGDVAKDQAKLEKPLPSSLIKINQSLEDKAKAFEASSLELKNAADAFNQFSGGKPKSGKINEMIVKAKGLLFSQPEIPIRNELQRVLNLGGLGAEAQAQGGAVRSNAMVNLATKYIPDVWKNPEAAMEKAQVTAEVKDRMAKVFRAEAEWNAQFRGKQNAPDDADVAGISVQKGQSKSNFITAFTASLFPEDEVTNTPALNALIGAKSPPKAAPSAPTSNLGRPVSTGTLPVTPAGGVFTIDGVEIKVAPRNK